jgi:hypothetical protein
MKSMKELKGDRAKSNSSLAKAQRPPSDSPSSMENQVMNLKKEGLSTDVPERSKDKMARHGGIRE